MNEGGPRMGDRASAVPVERKRFDLEWIFPLEPGLSTHVALYDQDELEAAYREANLDRHRRKSRRPRQL